MQRNKKKYLQNKGSSKNIKVVILCGGVGYRLKEETEFKPKPMVEIGGKPILWHILKIYSHYGFRDFIIALGYKGNLIKDYFVNNKYYDGDFTLNTLSNKIKHYPKETIDNLRITFVDTGLESLTGERVRRIKKYINEENFMVTYGDGIADINLNSLYKTHVKTKAQVTVTGVSPDLRFGGFDIDKDGFATKFEKRAKIRQVINGGFMVFRKKMLDLIKPNTMIEDIFYELVDKKQLNIYKHPGFFHAMDTYQDMQDLNAIWRENPAWKIWD